MTQQNHVPPEIRGFALVVVLSLMTIMAWFGALAAQQATLQMQLTANGRDDQQLRLAAEQAAWTGVQAVMAMSSDVNAVLAAVNGAQQGWYHAQSNTLADHGYHADTVWSNINAYVSVATNNNNQQGYWVTLASIQANRYGSFYIIGRAWSADLPVFYREVLVIVNHDLAAHMPPLVLAQPIHLGIRSMEVLE